MEMEEDTDDKHCINSITNITNEVIKLRDASADHDNSSLEKKLNLYSDQLNEIKNKCSKSNNPNSLEIIKKIEFAEQIISNIENEIDATNSSETDTIERHEIELPSSNLLLLNNNELLETENTVQSHLYHDYIHSIFIAVIICIILVILWNLA